MRQRDKEYVRRTEKLIKNNNRPWPNAAHAPACVCMCEHRQRVPPCPVLREDTWGHALWLATCTVPPSDIWSRTEHLCRRRLACTQNPVGSPMGCSQLHGEEDGMCVQTQAPLAAAAHTPVLVTVSQYVLCAVCCVPPRYPGCCGHPFISGQRKDEGAWRKVCAQGVCLAWVSRQDPAVQPRTRDPTKPVLPRSTLSSLQWIYTCHLVSAHLCSSYVHWLVLAFILCFFYNLRCHRSVGMPFLLLPLHSHPPCASTPPQPLLGHPSRPREAMGQGRELLWLPLPMHRDRLWRAILKRAA